MIDRGRSPEWGAFADRSTGSASFEAFYREHYRSVVRLATSVLGDAHSAQDVAQEVFLAAHDRFRGDVERAPGWVRVAAVHSALNVIRGDRRRDRRHLLAARAEAVPGPEDAVVEQGDPPGGAPGSVAPAASLCHGVDPPPWRDELRGDRGRVGDQGRPGRHQAPPGGVGVSEGVDSWVTLVTGC